jgi:oxygen-independent coproporphyrinogen-3 oxidase
MPGIYLHIPFCKQACHYCDFHFSTSLKNKQPLVTALQSELILRSQELEGQKVNTIYFGGGTPSLLTAEEISSLLKSIEQHYNIAKNAEITLEANPDDLSEEKIIELSKTSVNRLSIGIQSFFDEDLQMMNRAHNAKESESCLSIAKHYFKNITIDLIYGIPGLTTKRWKENLQKSFNYGIPHISSYALTVEEKTALASFIKNKKYPELDENLALEHFQILISETQKKGFVQYEISNFGQPGYFSKHNSSYWEGEPYIGIGPSAHSFHGNQRSWNISNNAKYIQKLQQNELALTYEKLTKKDRYNEYIMTGLRTIYGISLEKVTRDFGEDYHKHLSNEAVPFLDDKTLTWDKNFIKVTSKGKFLTDGIAASLFFI